MRARCHRAEGSGLGPDRSRPTPARTRGSFGRAATLGSRLELFRQRAGRRTMPDMHQRQPVRPSARRLGSNAAGRSPTPGGFEIESRSITASVMMREDAQVPDGHESIGKVDGRRSRRPALVQPTGNATRQPNVADQPESGRGRANQPPRAGSPDARNPPCASERHPERNPNTLRRRRRTRVLPGGTTSSSKMIAGTTCNGSRSHGRSASSSQVQPVINLGMSRASPRFRIERRRLFSAPSSTTAGRSRPPRR